MSKVIVFASPLFLLLIAIEFWWSRRVLLKTKAAGSAAAVAPVGYRLNDTLANLSLGMTSQLFGVLTRLVLVGIYGAVYNSVALFPDAAIWSSWQGALLALVFYDFCYYWQHRAGHEVAVIWAGHVVHHQSQTFNLGTALRQPSTTFWVGWIFYLPMAVAGVPPALFGIVALVDLLYQFWVHTEYVGKLGWFDRWFCSPSNHRVHHAVNDGYTDKNYGGILIIWDRIFGSFKEEGAPCIYGTRSQLNSWNPLWANFEVYWALWQTSRKLPRWRDKLMVWFKPPGWEPADLDARLKKPAFELRQVSTFDPPMGPGLMWFSGLNFLALLGAVLAVLWHADDMSFIHAAVWTTAISAGMWALGAAIQGRLSPWLAVMVQSAALATVTSVMELVQWHYLFKPLTMVLAIVFVAFYGRYTRLGGPYSLQNRLRGILIAALVFSALGDVLLMLPGNFFIPGLLAFLIAHLCFIALFRQTTSAARWFPNRVALLCTLLAGAAMFAYVAPGLRDPVLKAAVAVYALVISLMAAQAIGRASVLRTEGALCVAVGAGIFMLSDSLIAINRFVQPIEMSALWVLGTYYTAQVLIVANVLTPPARQ